MPPSATSADRCTEARSVLVVGASGPTGGEVVRAVKARGGHIRGLARSDDAARRALAQGADEIGLADLRDMHALPEALAGVDAAFYFCPRASPDEAALGRAFIQTAEAAGVKRVVIISMIHAEAPIPNHQASLEVEEALARTPMQTVVLQPAMFMQTFPSLDELRASRMIGRPYPTDKLLSLVDLRDVAQVAARALLDDDMVNGSFELCSDGMQSIGSMAAILTEELGEPILAEEITLEAWAAIRGETFASPHRRETYAAMFDYFARYGYKGGNALVLRHLLGREPTSFRQFVARGGKTAPFPAPALRRTPPPPPSRRAPMSGKCPVKHGFSMMDPEFVADPYAQCPALLQQPVFYAPDLDAYVVTRYRDVDAMLPDTGHYSSSNTVAPITPPSAEAMAVLAAADYGFRPNLINADPPRHTMVKKFVADAISPRRLRALEPIVRDWAQAQIETMLTKERADIFADLAFPLPALTGFSLIGFPPEDLDLLKSWCDRRVAFTYGRSPEDEQVRVAESVAAFWGYVNEFIAGRIANPTDDFTSEMVRHHLQDPEAFSARDIAGVLFGMSLAAHETTTNLVVNGVRRLLENRDQWDALVADPSLIPNAVEECLRHDTPVIAWRRRAKQDIDIDGTTIPADATIMMLFFSANRDPAQFEDPDVFDITRRDARKHVTFGKGQHFCSGAPLARMEMRVVLELLVEKAPTLTLVPDQTYEFVPNIALRAPQELLVDMVPTGIPHAAGVGR